MFTAQQEPSRAGQLVDAATIKAEFVANGYVVKLFKAGWAPVPTNTAADFAAHECDYTGYASKPFGGAGHLFSATFVDVAGRIVFASPTELFQATDAVAPNQIGGYWAENTAGAVRAFCLFPAPVDFTFALAAMLPTIFVSPNGESYCEVDN